MPDENRRFSVRNLTLAAAGFPTCLFFSQAGHRTRNHEFWT